MDSFNEDYEIVLKIPPLGEFEGRDELLALLQKTMANDALSDEEKASVILDWIDERRAALCDHA